MDIVVFDDVNMIRMYFGVTLFVDFTGFDILHARQVLLILIQCKIIVFFISKNISSNKNELL